MKSLFLNSAVQSECKRSRTKNENTTTFLYKTYKNTTEKKTIELVNDILCVQNGKSMPGVLGKNETDNCFCVFFLESVLKNKRYCEVSSNSVYISVVCDLFVNCNRYSYVSHL